MSFSGNGQAFEGKAFGHDEEKYPFQTYFFLFVAYVYDCLEQLLTLRCSENEIKTCDEYGPGKL